MSEKNLIDEKVDSDDDEDDDYCPIKANNEQSDPSDESEHDNNDADDNIVEQTENKNKTDLNITPYDESKTNELWKNFTSSSSTTNDSPKATAIEIPKPPVQSTNPTATTSQIFEYAGEKVSVPVTAATATSSLKRPAASSTTSNSLLDRLGIGKKQKLSTLEKSRLDWNVHKESESLIEDLDSHRRGKDSYVEKKAFLQRSELREHDTYLTNVKKK